ncbi:MAG: beta-glucosidase [Flavobacteriaceae bacterium]|nr:beta-glucosidase [Flavobacteriaceae bacterium]
MKKYILYLFITWSVQVNAQITDAKLNQLIDQLSIEEKVYLVIGTGMDLPGLTEKIDSPSPVVGMTQDKIPGAAGTSFTNSKHNFPAVVFADGPAGIRISPIRETYPNQTFYATAFPTATSISSTWNIELAKEIGSAFGREGKEYGVDFLLAPALNIHRNPLGGRNFEYYSEDPVLSGKIAAAFINGVQTEGVGATIKHFVANNSETNRMELNTVVSERALREIYLKGFEIAVKESQPWAVMSSYNKINGIYASENEELLTKILREEWKFDGFVMTDWFGGKDPVAQMKAGNDLLMPGTKMQAASILEAINLGSLDIKIIDRNIKYILKQYYRTHSFKSYKPTNKPDLDAHKIIAMSAASEGIILLKNNNALPLKPTTKIALFGVTSVETIAGGTGSGDVNKAYMVSVTEGLINQGYTLDQNLLLDYNSYVKEARAAIPPKNMFFEKDILVQEKNWSIDRLEEIATNNDVAIFTLGRTSGEFQDREIDADFNLTADEFNLIKNISNVFHSKNKKFIVILNIGGVIETNTWKNYADAIVLAWQPGQEAGNAIANILAGNVNPSGKLPITFPIAINDVASSKNFPGKLIDPTAPKSANPMIGMPSKEIYEEGIYIGYRYFDSFKIPVSFPFGYGLSYTKFEYSNFIINKVDDDIFLECSVKNIGNTEGKEVVQLYVKSAHGKLEKPEKELKGFAKTKLLKIGETQRIKIKTNLYDLGSYDTASHSWKLDKGNYTFMIASDSETIKLQKSIGLKEKILLKTQRLLSPKDEINELSKQ